MQPPITGFEYMPELPSWSFLVESSTTGKKALFDLGIPPDWETFAPVVTAHLKTAGWDVRAEKHTSQILEENGVDLKGIGSIIWRYLLSPTWLFCGFLVGGDVLIIASQSLALGSSG